MFIGLYDRFFWSLLPGIENFSFAMVFSSIPRDWEPSINLAPSQASVPPERKRTAMIKTDKIQLIKSKVLYSKILIAIRVP
jgi:hypothetical protein